MAFHLSSLKKRLKGQEGGEEDMGEVAVDPQALEAFAAGARERRGAQDEPPPWEGQDPEALPRYNVSIRLNDYPACLVYQIRLYWKLIPFFVSRQLSY